MAVPRPDDALERALVDAGHGVVAGVDEVGRGAWAGPASVGVVVAPPDRPPPPGLRDSKLLTEPRREVLFDELAGWCSAWSVGHVTPGECDRLGMTAALRLAAQRALADLPEAPTALLLDGGHDYLRVADDGEPPTQVDGPEVRTVVRGDSASVSIAAASVLAKVTRDRLMRALAPSFPPFDFDRNKGYPSRAHRVALNGFGLTSVHRRSWSYVAGLPFR